jgi:Protein of unknown function (DUF3179)
VTKKLYYFGLASLSVFEFLGIYFIMPMPGSQGINSLGVAYFLYEFRWAFRCVFVAAITAGALPAFRERRKWPPITAGLAAAGLVWFLNFQMAAEKIFQQPEKLTLRNRHDSSVKEGCIVIGIENKGEAKAYPIRFLVYHHQVQDTIGGKPVIVTYCSVCRTGCVFEPVVNGHLEKFRLVGMDHFNAMFEDATTHSWWRQATGEAVAGTLKGTNLPVMAASQMSLRKWMSLHPDSLVMQPDESSMDNYDTEGRFERGKSKGELTRTDPGSWKEKSWIVGVQIGSVSKAYDWNHLKAKRVINDVVGGVPVVLVLSGDRYSFAAFRRPEVSRLFTLDGEVLISSGQHFDLSGRNFDASAPNLVAVDAHQEFWHSWRTFYPETSTDL